MPVLVIFELDQTPKLATISGGECHVGRDDTNQIVLPGKGISRRHATFTTDAAGSWVIRCESKTNRIVVDGALIGGEAQLADGSEILIGPDHLFIFSESESKARGYAGGQKIYAQSTCGACGWVGMVSAVRKNPICPKCASPNLHKKEAYARDEALEKAEEGATEHVNHQELRASLKKLKTAKRSHLERIDGRDGADVELTESDPVLIGTGAGTAFELAGFVIGSGIEIRWTDAGYVAKSSLSLPAMKINGLKTDNATLKSGDVIEVGKNRFRFVTE